MLNPLQLAGWPAPVQGWLRHPSLRGVKNAIRHLQTGLDYADFRRLNGLVAALPLAPLLAYQPRFAYKYLSPYIAASFGRRARLAALFHHYRFLAATGTARFFHRLARQPVLWQERRGDDLLAVRLSYPLAAGFEAELSLSCYLNGVLAQVVSFVLVPGALAGLPQEDSVLLFSQVQGVKNPALMKRATKALHEITPAVLLVQAAYGLAEALGIGRAAGIRSTDQLSAGPATYFDHDAFWGHLKGELSPDGRVYQLLIPTPEKPMALIAANNRARHARKRAYKHQVRAQVAHAGRRLLGHA